MNERTRAALERAAAIKERRERGGSNAPAAKEEEEKEKEEMEEKKEEKREEEKREEEKKEDAEKQVKGAFSVGDEVMAMWAEDRLHYRARIEKISPDAQRYDVVFQEYGNRQEDTHVSWIMSLEMAEQLAAEASVQAEEVVQDATVATAGQEDGAVANQTEDDESSSVEDIKKAVAAKLAANKGDEQDDKWELTDSIPPPPTSERRAEDAQQQQQQQQQQPGSLKSAKVVGQNPDGSPIYMTAEEEAHLRHRKKQDKMERKAERKGKVEKAKKGFLSKLKKKDAEDAPPPSVVPETTSWSKTSESPRADAAPPIPPTHPKLSPRRAPPAPPKKKDDAAAADQTLEPLPPIVTPAKTDDHRQCGHVFVTLGDLRRLHCDAWVIPTGRDFVPSQHWFLESNVRPRNYAGVGASGLKYFGTQNRVMRAPGWPDRDRPYPYLVFTQQEGDTFDWLLTPVTQFLELATAELKGVAPERSRLKHLIALPVIGTGFGGRQEHKGAVIQALLPILMEHAKNRNVDIVLVTNDVPLFSAVQNARRNLPQSFATLDSRLKAKADELARFARAGKLSLFIGAGVSIGAGLPTWGGLMGELMDEAKISQDSRAELKEMSFLDQARLLQDRLGGAEKMAEAVCKRLTSVAYSISHSLLASLPVSSVVSTNFDGLFEMASQDAGHPCSVLPYEPSREASSRRFVLKMHGDVNHKDIVLTREDYLRYDNRKGALAGIVQSLLITHHMFFCGFSLTDDNFMKIVDQVRLAISNTTKKLPGKKFASATFLHENALFSELWSDIDIIAMERQGKDFPEAGNVLEIFLDFLTARTASSASFLLESHYDELLTDEDKAFKKHLEQWLEAFPSEARKSQGYSLLKNQLRETFGGLKIAE